VRYLSPKSCGCICLGSLVNEITQTKVRRLWLERLQGWLLPKHKGPLSDAFDEVLA